MGATLSYHCDQCGYSKRVVTCQECGAVVNADGTCQGCGRTIDYIQCANCRSLVA